MGWLELRKINWQNFSTEHRQCCRIPTNSLWGDYFIRLYRKDRVKVLRERSTHLNRKDSIEARTLFVSLFPASKEEECTFKGKLLNLHCVKLLPGPQKPSAKRSNLKYAWPFEAQKSWHRRKIKYQKAREHICRASHGMLWCWRSTSRAKFWYL